MKPTEYCHALFHSSYTSVGEEAIIGEKSDWGLPQCEEGSRDVHRFNRHERGLRKKRGFDH